MEPKKILILYFSISFMSDRKKKKKNLKVVGKIKQDKFNLFLCGTNVKRNVLSVLLKHEVENF